ncbi:MAG TPA: MBL fold metallo-hydrolase [Erysipelotrichaceae bacterium]|nr:MBL fold metallo-hydrolase [Erysipelotrichaceae bacterium]
MIIFLTFIALYLGLSLRYAYVVVILISAIFLFFVFKRCNLFLTLISLGVIVLGFSWSFIDISYQKSTYQGIVYEAKQNYFLFNSGGERLYVHAKNHDYDIGDFLSIEGEKSELDFTVLESDFNFNEFLNKKGVFYSLESHKITVKFHNFIRIKQRREEFLENFETSEKSIVGAILFSSGEETPLTSEIKSLHLSRFLSASGLYILAFVTFMNFLLKMFLKDKIGEAITILLVILYSVFTFPRFALIRVCFLLIFKWINKYLLKKKFNYLEILSFLGIFFLLLDRYLVRQDCFILGFAIPIIAYLIRDIYPHHQIKRFLMKSVTIYLFFLPFEINYYHKIAIFSLPLQVVSAPLFIAIGVISLLCFFYVPLIKVDKVLILILQTFIKIIEPLNLAILMPSLNIGLLFLYESLYLIYLYYLSLGMRPFQHYLTWGLVSLMMVYALPIDNALSVEVSFINVGQGDCTMVRYHNQVSLIDTGGLNYKDIAKDVLLPYLHKKRIHRLDNVFITHYDEDHFGALSSLKENIYIDNIYDYHSSFPVRMGTIEFINYNIYSSESEDENERSLVLGFKALDLHFLLMGDAPKEVERKIISQNSHLKCDVLKVGHHGSDTSSSEIFIKQLRPEVAVISCGKNNSFGHPSKSVISILKKYKILIRRTDLEGTITFKKRFV